MPHADSVPDVLPFRNLPFTPTGILPSRIFQLSRSHDWLHKLLCIRMTGTGSSCRKVLMQHGCSQSAVAVTQVVLLVFKRTMQATGSFPPREPLLREAELRLFHARWAYVAESVVRGLQAAVERGYFCGGV